MPQPARFIFTETDEFLISHGGLSMIGALIAESGIRKGLKSVLSGKTPGVGPITDSAIAMMGLLCLGKPDFCAIETFRDDEYFRRVLGVTEVPPESTFRQRIDRVATMPDIHATIRDHSARLVGKYAPSLTPCFKDFIPLDGDVTTLDNSGTKKEGVSCTYMLFDGYAPMVMNIGSEGYLLHAQLREGSQHCQKDTPQFLKESFDLAKKVTKMPLLVRLDSGNDAIENITVCRKEKIHFVIKRNLHKESIAEWLLDAQAFGEWRTPREGKTVYVGNTIRERNGKHMRVVFEVIERTMTRDSQMLLVPEIEVNTWWTDLGVRTASADDIIAIYHAHATSEQYHSELKSDMALERLPSGKFATNALVLTFALMAFNMLRLCGQVGIKNGFVSRKDPKRRRIRTVIQDMIYMAARIVTHGRRLYMALAGRNRLRNVLAQTYMVFAGSG
jgi:hypothetical protein